ncbi:MAG: type II toxin-antitoxin system RelE/ParE family toxin [Balneolaceae bacterium]|nr:MAG: type II toxin-antitoxin system RelE/ParE family toxin [Balneolaceae bacterium]
MIVRFHKSFAKDLSKIKDKSIRKKVKKAILKLENSPSIDKITNLKAIKGEKNAYRLRVGDYRIGIYLKTDSIELIRVAHRKDIYDLFP